MIQFQHRSFSIQDLNGLSFSIMMLKAQSNKFAIGENCQLINFERWIEVFCQIALGNFSRRFVISRIFSFRILGPNLDSLILNIFLTSQQNISLSCLQVQIVTQFKQELQKFKRSIILLNFILSLCI